MNDKDASGNAEDFFDRRLEFYDSDDQYEKTIREIEEFGHDAEDSEAYLPDPELVQERAFLVRWLTGMRFSPRMIESIMVHEVPTVRVVLRLVRLGRTPSQIEEHFERWIGE